MLIILWLVHIQEIPDYRINNVCTILLEYDIRHLPAL